MQKKEQEPKPERVQPKDMAQEFEKLFGNPQETKNGVSWMDARVSGELLGVPFSL